MADFSSNFGIGDHVSYTHAGGGRRASGTVVSVKFGRSNSAFYTILSDANDNIVHGIRAGLVTTYVVDLSADSIENGHYNRNGYPGPYEDDLIEEL